MRTKERVREDWAMGSCGQFSVWFPPGHLIFSPASVEFKQE